MPVAFSKLALVASPAFGLVAPKAGLLSKTRTSDAVQLAKIANPPMKPSFLANPPIDNEAYKRASARIASARSIGAPNLKPFGPMDPSTLKKTREESPWNALHHFSLTMLESVIEKLKGSFSDNKEENAKLNQLFANELAISKNRGMTKLPFELSVKDPALASIKVDEAHNGYNAGGESRQIARIISKVRAEPDWLASQKKELDEKSDLYKAITAAEKELSKDVANVAKLEAALLKYWEVRMEPKDEVKAKKALEAATKKCVDTFKPESKAYKAVAKMWSTSKNATAEGHQVDDGTSSSENKSSWGMFMLKIFIGFIVFMLYLAVLSVIYVKIFRHNVKGSDVTDQVPGFGGLPGWATSKAF